MSSRESRATQSVSSVEQTAAHRATATHAERRRRLLLAGGAVLAVLAIAVAFLGIKLTSHRSTTADKASNGPAGSALASAISEVTSVPASTLETVGSGSGAVTAKPTTISGSTLSSNGKPEILYEGAEYCPYCAAQRWAVIVALSRFGTFSGLRTVHSGAVNGAGQAEPFQNVPTWTFYKTSYTSTSVAFVPVETQTNIPDVSSGGYTTLQTPTSAQRAIVTKYDGARAEIPFIDFGNKYVISGSSYDPGVLSGLTWNQIAADLSNPSSPVAKAIDGSANYITAATCTLTGNQPANVCTPAITSLQNQI